MFKGSIVALVTPFKNGKIDEEKLRELIEFQIENGTSAIVPCGTTGESATLSYEEHERVVEITVEQVNKRVRVIAGTGSNSTAEAIRLTVHAEKVGADASLQISPYYNKPTQKGLYLHFKKIAETVKIPIILYNVKSRTGINIEPETVARLAKDCPNIVGIKEASGSLGQMAKIKQLCGPKFDLLSGDDGLTLPILAIGGTGVISVVANIAPKDVSEMISEFEKGNLERTQEIFYRLLPLVKAMFIETNPIPVKTALAMMGKIEENFRLPLCSMEEKNRPILKSALEELNLI